MYVHTDYTNFFMFLSELMLLQTVLRIFSFFLQQQVGNDESVPGIIEIILEFMPLISYPIQ